MLYRKTASIVVLCALLGLAISFSVASNHNGDPTLDTSSRANLLKSMDEIKAEMPEERYSEFELYVTYLQNNTAP